MNPSVSSGDAVEILADDTIELSNLQALDPFTGSTVVVQGQSTIVAGSLPTCYGLAGTYDIAGSCSP